MANNPMSPFQIIHWNVINFNYSRGILYLPPDIQHQWTIKAHIEKLKPTDETLQAIVDITFSMLAEHEGSKMDIQGQCLALCSLETKDLDNVEARFDHLTRTSAMVNSLANLRVFLMQQGALLQVGPKRIMLPFINLNNFPFDEDVTVIV